MDIRYSWSYSCLLPRFVLDVVVIYVPEAGESGARLASPALDVLLPSLCHTEREFQVNRPSQHVISHPQDRIAEYAIKYIRG